MPVDLIPPPPESETAVAAWRWVSALLASALVALGSTFLWLLDRFLRREEKFIAPLTGSVDSLADSVSDLTDEVGTVSEHQSEANKIAHDQLVLAAHEQQNGRR